MKRFIIVPLLTPLLLASCSGSPGEIVLSTDTFEISLSSEGMVRSLVDLATQTDYLDHDAPILSLRIDNVLRPPVSATLDGDALNISFDGGMDARIQVRRGSAHFSFELFSISNPDTVELVVWGPYPTTINRVIGETVGVVQGEEFAIGIQALNPRTLGGFPWNENDAMPQLDIFESGDYSDLSEEGKRHVLYRVEAAKPDSFGSTLQAYTRNRAQDRIIENWGHERYVAPARDDGGIVGSKIALFGVPVEDALETVGKIELEEGLPHPMIDGAWGKQTPTASAAYLILAFGEEDIDRALEVTRKAGLRYLYHPGPFENWGHFDLNPDQFPDGDESMRRIVDRAAEMDIMVGTHILSNFITTNDPYVTPVPDPRLAKVGSSVLTEEISPTQTSVTIASPVFFNQFNNNHLRAVVVGNEIIRYGSISDSPPWRLMDCQRGAYGTRASVHETGQEISKLADHGYKVFLTDADLTVEMAGNVAGLYNRTGMRQISFDGLEGNRSTGMGNYGEILFTQTWFDSLSDDIRAHYIADASRTSHYFWHMYTRMNWGEPWYAGFRESQTDYRLKNQKYFRRNMMPGMLGWFRMTAETSIEDIEWMLARSAAFDAGYAFVTGYQALEKNGHSDEILALLGQWEEARMAGAFSAAQKLRMEDIANEFRLERVGDADWNLYRIYSYKYRHEARERQPGEPTHSTFRIENQSDEQAMRFILTAVGGTLSAIRMEMDNYREISLNTILQPGEILQYRGGNTATRYSSTWQILGEVVVDAGSLTVAPGAHSLQFDTTFSGADEASAKLEFRFTGRAERVSAN